MPISSTRTLWIRLVGLKILTNQQSNESLTWRKNIRNSWTYLLWWAIPPMSEVLGVIRKSSKECFHLSRIVLPNTGPFDITAVLAQRKNSGQHRQLLCESTRKSNVNPHKLETARKPGKSKHKQHKQATRSIPSQLKPSERVCFFLR